jgi:hypothetical protein
MQGDVGTFGAELEELKRSGANLLVLSDPGSSATICDHLLGDDAELRRRLFVSAGSGDTPARRSVSDPSRLGVVEVTGGSARSSSRGSVPQSGPTETGREATGSPSIPDRPGPVGPNESAAWYSRPAGLDDLPGIARHVHQHLRRFETYDPEPSEIRVCVDSLDPLVDRAEQEALLRFLHVLTNRLRAADAMSHVHLSAAADAALVRTVHPLFDAIVEVRTTMEGPHQRWTLGAADFRTDWLPLTRE